MTTTNQAQDDGINLFFDCGLRGELLSYLRIWRLEGLTEKGKDRFISLLLDEVRRPDNLVPKRELDDLKEAVRAVRDQLWDKMPSGYDCQEFRKLIVWHCAELDMIVPPTKGD